jgi:hypothetical protein
MTTYTWIISQLDTAPQDGDLHDVVKTIHWRYQGTEVVGDKTYTAEVYSSYGCAQPSDTDFTAYPDLTENQVISWLEDGLDVTSLKANIDAQIENQKNPPIVNLGLPWENQA